MPLIKLFKSISERFVHECHQRDIEIDGELASFILHIFARDKLEGFVDVKKLSECKIKNFIEKAIERYEDVSDAIFNGLKMCFIFKNAKELKLDAVKEKYEMKFEKELKQLIDGILQYPETSDKKQIEQMFVKMQVFIVANYNLGCPKNHVLLRQTRQSMNSVIGRGDLQHYVLKKKYHRLEYLQRLSATVCGILVYNNHSPGGDKENMRDMLADIEDARNSTKESFESALKRADELKVLGMEAIDDLINVNILERIVRCRRPIDRIREINKYVGLFVLYERYVCQLNASYENTENLIKNALNRYACVVEKIDDILKFRTAIDSEVIFPHFVYLSEVWSSLVLYLNHLTELNRIKDAIDACVNEELEKSFIAIVDELCNGPPMKASLVKTFPDLMQKTMEMECQGNLLKVDEYHKNFCSLTLALTGGLLSPSTVQRKLCENLSNKFGLRSFEHINYAESHFDVFLHCFRNAIFTSVELILLFNLEDEILKDDLAEVVVEQPKSKSLETQTEMVVENDLSVPNRINVTWNVWDYHRETIRLANLRRRQTHSTQTVHSFGQRNAQNQMYNVRSHFK